MTSHLTDKDRRQLAEVSCPRHRPGTENFVCHPCADAEIALVESIVEGHVNEERATWAQKLANVDAYIVDKFNEIAEQTQRTMVRILLAAAREEKNRSRKIETGGGQAKRRAKDLRRAARLISVDLVDHELHIERQEAYSLPQPPLERTGIPCRACGPGYSIGDEGCRHTDNDAERTIGETGICRTCVQPIWWETGTIGHQERISWSDRNERGGDSIVCFRAIHYRHEPLGGREQAIYDAGVKAGRADERAGR